MAAAPDARFVRVVKRSYTRAKQQHDTLCAICLENVDMNGDNLQCVTICDHVFHGQCWHQHCRAFFYEGVDPNVADLLTTFIYAQAGPPCPVCRTALPRIDHLAYAVQDDRLMQPMQGVKGLNVDFSLKLAAAKK